MAIVPEPFAGLSGTSGLAIATDAAHRTIGLTWRTDRPLPAPATRFRDFVTGRVTKVVSVTELPVLEPDDQRVLGSLLEKQTTVPGSYR